MVSRLLILAVLLLALPASAGAIVPGTNGRIAFDSDHDSTSDIYTVEPDGTGVLRLTTSRDYEDDPAWSPNGRRIAYIRRQEVWVMDADGSDQHRVTHMKDDLADPSWSPDGRRLIFVTIDRARDVWTIAPSGSKLRQVTKTRQSEFEPSYAPSGKRISYVRFSGSSNTVITADPDGSRRKALPTVPYGTLNANWSPDGRQLAQYNADQTLFLTNSDGSDRKAVGYGNSPAFSPDGRFLAFSDQDPEGERGAIIAKSLQGGDDVKVTPFPGRDLCDNPDWQTLPR